jgi:hypothetical protein
MILQLSFAKEIRGYCFREASALLGPHARSDSMLRSTVMGTPRSVLSLDLQLGYGQADTVTA